MSGIIKDVENLQFILTIVLVIELLVIAACFILITLFFARLFKIISNLSESIGRFRSFVSIPALIIAIVSKLIKRGR